ncbi:MAG: response regulator [Lachnospiraceae bacterium]|jgi:ppGpp synthetase/RelA/SpoT-type nucleotidyltranferase/FixJ family two-component response regulator|nr:response regulator [Lachnospiraceae bacterium]MCI9135488.1 response regulator [Lachnospiraceae bacterium]
MQKILVVDDAELNRELLRDMLEDEFLVETAEDGERALQKLQRRQSELSALLLDLHMPKFNGFAVIEEMRRRGWMERIPVLIISSEHAVEVENRCFELGVSDFIHKPFEGSIVKNRVKNAIELFTCKLKLQQKVEEQEETLRAKDQIIQRQAQKLREAKPFNKLMLEYQSAIMEVETRLKVLNAEFSQEYNRNPFESIKSRLKTPESIYEKLERKGQPITVENVQEHLHDVAGLRVICSFPDDIYRLARLLTGQDDIILLREKDYIKEPKDNGYRSLHLILSIPIFLPAGKKYMKVEVQFRTIAMDFWASLEHKLKYKKTVDNTEEIVGQLKMCADSIEELDYRMQEIRDQIDRSHS